MAMMNLMRNLIVVDAYTTPGTERETCLSADELLRQMDQAGIARALIAPQDRELAVDNRAGNERVIRMAGASAGRFIPACGVNPWLGDKGLAELERSASDGARLLVLAPVLQGFMLTDPVADALLQHAGRLNIPVYVHTGPHSSSAPTQLALVAERFAGTRFILGHCGSTDYSHDMPSIFAMRLPNLWYELSFVRPWSVARYASLAMPGRLIFGTSAPRNVQAFELDCFNVVYPVNEHADVYGTNFLRLIGEAE